MLSLEELLKQSSFVINGEEYENTLSDDLFANPENLEEEFSNQARLMAIYGFAYDKALDNESQLKAELERIYALIDAKIRNNFVTTGTKFTEKMVHNSVITDFDYQHKQREHQEAKFVASQLKSACTAIMHKKDMLVGLGANYRAQISAEPSIKGL